MVVGPLYALVLGPAALNSHTTKHCMFKFIPPCSPIPATTVPAGEAWVHEVKFDGYRVQLHKQGRDVVIYSRNGHGFTDRFATIAMLLRELPVKAAVLDGEIVASNRAGAPDFRKLHRRSAEACELHLWVFDVWRSTARTCARSRC
jgi:bifunctional non-homologous end joining protein LigD